MRILYFIHHYQPGTKNSDLHRDYLEALAAAGMEVTVLAPDAELRGGPLLRESRQGALRVVHAACSRSPRARALNRVSRQILRYPFFCSLLFAYRRLLGAEPFDVIDVSTAFPIGGVAASPGAPAAAHVVTPRGEDLIVEPGFDYGHRRFALPRALARRSLAGAAVVRCISPMLAALAADAGARTERCAAVACNVRAGAVPDDAAAFRRRSRAEIRSRLGIDAGIPFVLSLGRLHPFKGLDALVRALGVRARRGRPFAALIVGRARATPRFGDYRDYLRRVAAEENVGNQVRFLDEIGGAEVAPMLAAADVVVVPSTTESFNRVTIEAAAVGTPVVVTRSTGISAYLDGEPWGVVAESREPEALENDIDRALALGEAALAGGPAFARQFLPDAIVRDMLPLYVRAESIGRGR